MQVWYTLRSEKYVAFKGLLHLFKEKFSFISQFYLQFFLTFRKMFQVSLIYKLEVRGWPNFYVPFEHKQ